MPAAPPLAPCPAAFKSASQVLALPKRTSGGMACARCILSCACHVSTQLACRACAPAFMSSIVMLFVAVLRFIKTHTLASAQRFADVCVARGTGLAQMLPALFRNEVLHPMGWQHSLSICLPERAHRRCARRYQGGACCAFLRGEGGPCMPAVARTLHRPQLHYAHWPKSRPTPRLLQNNNIKDAFQVSSLQATVGPGSWHLPIQGTPTVWEVKRLVGHPPTQQPT